MMRRFWTWVWANTGWTFAFERSLYALDPGDRPEHERRKCHEYVVHFCAEPGVDNGWTCHILAANPRQEHRLDAAGFTIGDALAQGTGRTPARAAFDAFAELEAKQRVGR
jgi:hypothetical protein